MRTSTANKKLGKKLDKYEEYSHIRQIIQREISATELPVADPIGYKNLEQESEAMASKAYKTLQEITALAPIGVWCVHPMDQVIQFRVLRGELNMSYDYTGE